MNRNYVTMDGNEAAATMAYPFTEIAAIYPITPSSPMATLTDVFSAQGRKNLFSQPVTLTEMQSEAGAIGAVHGALQAGALATSFTSSQGLMLMIPTMYRIAGERLPAVLHVASRTVGTHSMSIFGDHSDVMACSGTGFALMSTGSVQEVADLASAAHLVAIETRIPFLHFFDGFRTSHEINKIDLPDTERIAALLNRDALAAFRDRALNPEHPTLRNTVQNGDVYFQVREANNMDYESLADTLEDCFAKISAITGREYHIFNYYGAPDATDVIIAMGSVSGAVREVMDAKLRRGDRVGFLQPHLYRPFSAKYFLSSLPESVRRVAVLDRCKIMGGMGEPLFKDVCTALSRGGRADVRVIGGRYGLSSKDCDPSQIVAVYDNLGNENPVESFTVGITDDVTHRSLPVKPYTGRKTDVVECKFWGLGGDGTVGANHSSVKIINDATDYFAQAYFEYDSKKSFGITKSHLRFSPRPIESSYYIKEADFVGCHNARFLSQYDIVGEVRKGGTLLINCSWTKEELSANLPARVKREIADKSIRLYTIDATRIAERLELGAHINTVLQSAFFALMEIIPKGEAIAHMKEIAKKTYYAKGDEIIERNTAAIDAGANEAVSVDIPGDWATAQDGPEPAEAPVPAVVKNILRPINAQKGDSLPVSAFLDYKDGHIDMGLTAYEKRGIAVQIPRWDAAKCLQCNRCSLVCPHAVIRPFLMNDAERESAPEGFASVKAKGADGLWYALAISDYDCTGCGSCVASCPAKEKAISMQPAALDGKAAKRWSYALSLSDKGDVFDPFSVKGSQFRTPLVEFSGACAGCGETPYAKLITQLYGDRIYWANGTGCSQAWGAPMASIPYTVNRRGFGPAWTNSLFENNAELMLGLYLATRQQRDGQRQRVTEYVALTGSGAGRAWLDAFDDLQGSREASDALIDELERSGLPIAKDILSRRDQLAKKTFWMFGGDGWAYDIGFGGLDHVIASGEDINVFVIDTEVYSNTGGQSSKATPLGAVAQFASAGKRSVKKDLGSIFRTYGNVYVAQVALGADPAQTIRAIREAEAHRGPSVIVAYTPCTAHGIRSGMADVQGEMKRAVLSGYWALYRYDPDKLEPMTLDSKAPTVDYIDFLEGETRYSSLRRTYPDAADTLFERAREDALKRYERLAEQRK